MEPLKKIDLRDLGVLNMAYLGDSVWELYVRTYFLEFNDGLDTYNKKVKSYVNAKKQAEIYHKMEKDVTDDELKFSRRARNAKIRTFPKSCEISEYRNATAFETLIAYWFLTNQKDKIDMIVKKYIIEGDKLEKII